MPWSLRSTITFLLAGLLVTISLLASVVLLRVNERLLLREVGDSAQATAHAIAASLSLRAHHAGTLREAWLHPELLQTELEQLAQLPDVLEMAVIGPDLRVLAHSDRSQLGRRILDLQVGPTLIEGTARGALHWEEGVRVYWAHHPLIVEGQPVAVLRAKLSLGALDQHLASGQSLMLLYLALDALLLILAGSYLLDRLIVRPLRRVAEATERVGHGDLQPIRVIRRRDEIGRLALSFNRMVEALASHRRSLQVKIAELSQANHELEGARRSMVRAERLASVGTLAAGVAHEVGNPLAAILGLSEFLEQELAALAEREPELAEARAIVERIHAQTLRIHKIIRDLLDYSRTRSQGAAQGCDVAAVARRTQRLLEPQPRLRGLDLQLDLAEPLPAVALEEDRLEQVLVNLLLNAADALRDGAAAGQDGSARLAVAARVDSEDPERVEIVVSDNGPGMAPEVQQRAFDPFFTTKEPGRGTGLGLAICERIVADAGGELRIDSAPGEGTRVVLRLPRRREVAAPGAAPDAGVEGESVGNQ